MDEVLFCPQADFLNGKLFDSSDERLNRDGTLRPFIELKRELANSGYDAKTIDTSKNVSGARAVFFIDMPRAQSAHYRACIEAKLRGISNLLIFEPPATRPDNYDPKNHENFSKVFTWCDDLIDGKKYFKNNFVMPYLASETIKLPERSFDSRKLLCLISANKYSPHQDQLYTERVNAIRFMERNHPSDFDLFGQRWDLPVFHSSVAERLLLNNFAKALHKLGRKSPTRMFPKWQYPSYAGPVSRKFEVMSKYKFSICYENQKNISGYVSEKIMDSMLSGCVPIYLGASNIEGHVPPECFVDMRKFAGYGELYEHISSIDEDRYARYISSISHFLNSKASYEYKIDFLIDAIKKAI